jgi:limonene-1,2-epoxide hydrolase
MMNTPQTPLEVVSTFMTALGKKDFNTALQYLSDDCEYTNIPISTVQGPVAVRTVLEAFLAPTLENEIVVKHVAVDGSVVFIERTDRHRLANGWVELPVTGVWEVQDGRITLWRDYFDVLTLQQAWPVSLGGR